MTSMLATIDNVMQTSAEIGSRALASFRLLVGLLLASGCGPTIRFVSQLGACCICCMVFFKSATLTLFWAAVPPAQIKDVLLDKILRQGDGMATLAALLICVSLFHGHILPPVKRCGRLRLLITRGQPWGRSE